MTTGYHAGELAVQQRLGVRIEADRLSPMLDRPELTGGVGRFLAQRTLAVVTARDEAGTLWTSPLTGAPGFLEVLDASTLRILGAPGAGDPLHDLPAGQALGLVAIEPGKGRRFRVNGRLTQAKPGALTVEVDQAYGNCPQYIQRRELRHDSGVLSTPMRQRPGPARVLTRRDLDQVEVADTFFLGTTHPTSGNDASHRGGRPGFVRTEDERTLWWPDYPGNNMFNSLGNLAADPTASLLFLDFRTGRSLQLSGRAELELVARGSWGDDGGTGRVVRFTTDLATVGPPLPLRADLVTAYPRNPPLDRRQRRAP